MKAKLKETAAEHNLDEIVYVRWVDDPYDDTLVQSEAHELIDKVLEVGEDSTVVGVYKLVRIEEVTRETAIATRRLA